jgi:hypothetical protein
MSLFNLITSFVHGFVPTVNTLLEFAGHGERLAVTPALAFHDLKTVLAEFRSVCRIKAAVIGKEAFILPNLSKTLLSDIAFGLAFGHG